MRLCLMQDHALVLELLLYRNPMVTLGLPYLLKNFLNLAAVHWRWVTAHLVGREQTSIGVTAVTYCLL